MLKIFVGGVALAMIALPAAAQSNASGSNGKMSSPSAQNSGVGIADQPGNKNGPPAKKPSDTTGQASSSGQIPSRSPKEDAAKVNGKAGSKVGPAVMPPNDKNLNGKKDSKEQQ